MSKQIIRLETKKVLSCIDISVEESKAFICSEDSGNVFHYDIDDIHKLSSEFTLVHSFCGAQKPLTIAYWPSRKEVYVGHAGGIISVYELKNMNSGPLCK